MTGEYNGVETGQNLKDDRSADQLIAEAVEKAKDADYVIMMGGLNKSDYQDCEGHDRKQYELPYAQNRLIEALAKVTDRLIYVNVSGNAVAMPWRNKVAAIVQSWFIGSEAGNDHRRRADRRRQSERQAAVHMVWKPSTTVALTL